IEIWTLSRGDFPPRSAMDARKPIKGRLSTVIWRSLRNCFQKAGPSVRRILLASAYRWLATWDLFSSASRWALIFLIQVGTKESVITRLHNECLWNRWLGLVPLSAFCFLNSRRFGADLSQFLHPKMES